MIGLFVRRLIRFTNLDRLLPMFVLGQPKESFICKFIPDNSDYAKPTYRFVKRNGIFFTLDLSDHMQWLVYFGHNVENRSALYTLAAQKETILDVGANVGETALNMAKTGSNVFAIEANPHTFKSFQKNINQNKNLNVVPLNLGLSNENGHMYVHNRTTRNKGADQLRSTSYGEDTIRIQVSTIDELVKQNDLPNKIDCIKIDVEGMELLVLQGAKDLLKRFKPSVFLEYSPENFKDYGYNGQDIIDFLSALDYKIVSVENSKIVSSASQIDGHTDLICT